MDKQLFFRFVKLLRTKEVIFWMLIFPIILITTFNTIISNIDMGETMETASLDIVKTAEMKNDQTPLEKIGEKNGKNLKLIKLNEKKAKKMLQRGKLQAYILPKPKKKTGRYNYTMVVSSMEDKQFFLKFYLDTVKHYENVTFRIKSPVFLSHRRYIKDKPVSESQAETNPNVVAIFAMMAMVCLNGIRMGVDEIAVQEADQSTIAARLFMMPLSKIGRFFSSGAASLAIQLIFVVMLVFYCTYIIDIGLKKEFLRFSVLMIIGTAVSYFIGTTFGSLLRISVNVKENLATIANLILSGMAGMYSESIKNFIDTNFAFANKVNPAAIVTNGFYSLYYYDDYGVFNKSLLDIGILGTVMFFITLIAVRRCEYDSI